MHSNYLMCMFTFLPLIILTRTHSISDFLPFNLQNLTPIRNKIGRMEKETSSEKVWLFVVFYLNFLFTPRKIELYCNCKSENILPRIPYHSV